MARLFDSICIVREDCPQAKKVIKAELLQIKIHLIQKHYYEEWQKCAFKYGLISSEKTFKSRGWFVSHLAELCIVKANNFIEVEKL